MEALKDKSVSDLLSLHVSILEELRCRGVTRRANNVTGELAEYLFCRAFGWDPAHKSHKGFDARDSDGRRYEIKGRRLDGRNPSRQLSAIRALTIVLDRDEDGIWVAECPSIPGCISQGTTEEKAMSNILEAVQLCLEVRAERGLPLTV